ncbi:Asp23/Gls24 family envelope stress response protein [Streptomyces sp. 5-8]|uniref:Asp23/Gls24 family envelope stress response protein n=1 Tax=Streptomyces musisoli TaxID=2802280 RepID=A0ABS1PDY1_9ACTN|nr:MULTISPECIES: Asp23/Gls24 family envelope stress response protein [Streptomyces]MBL1110370.1 Asp23/Gls24 family envelope stress response protein [Streptomyces musisoli]MBY8846655.1 Asp23/Gls24 family envelope stress response protein [Streptomyces sp. SP2-10]
MTPAASPGNGPPAHQVALPAPAERGATVIPDKVVARVAAQAGRVAQLHRAAIPPDRGQAAAPNASVISHRGSVRLHLAMDLPYPADLALVCEQIQHDVADRVAQVTGMHVDEVTLTIRRLVTASAKRRARVR